MGDLSLLITNQIQRLLKGKTQTEIMYYIINLLNTGTYRTSVQ